MCDERVGHGAWGDFSRPARDEGDAVSTFPEGAFVAAQGGVGAVVELPDVLVAIVHDAAVVAGEEHEGVIGEFESVERFKELRNGSVQFVDGVTAGSGGAAAFPAGMRDAGHVDVVGCEVEEERSVRIFLDELDTLTGEGIGHFFVHPACGFSTGHPSDASDAVDDGEIVTVGVFEFEGFRVFAAGGFGSDFLLVAHGDGIFGVEADDVMVFDVDGGNSVAGGGHDERLVKTEL